MISKLANETALYLKRLKPNNQVPHYKLQFALHLVYNVIFTLVLSLGVAIILGHFWTTLGVLASSFVLRRYSGGYHAATSRNCILITTLLSNAIPFLHLSGPLIYVLTIASLILAFVYAPSRIEHDTNIPKSDYKKLKAISICIIGANLFISSSFLAVTFFLQSLSLIRLNEGGETT